MTETAEPTATTKPKRLRSKSPTATPEATAVPTVPLPTLRILETRVLRGPNYWAREPVIRMLVDLGNLEEFPSNRIPGFSDALIWWPVIGWGIASVVIVALIARRREPASAPAAIADR